MAAKSLPQWKPKPRKLMVHSIIHSELTAQGFYEKMGYHVASDTFMEDGVPCVVVKKEL
ncbi:GNAT family N-acetyltransferase [Lentilactobacillus rapi]|uniref:GNAT family N-acetyltransferase n=1 Tax=Lentilactobacillus rapi TaxID=481723 RepID=UPI003BF53546